MEIQDSLLGTISDPQCRSQIVKMWKSAINLDVWALRMVDATAKIPVGLLTGNLNHFGNMDECIDVTVNEDSETFYGKHCLVHFPLTAISNRIPGAASLIQYKWGVCIPSSCSAEDLKNFLRYTLYLPAQVQEFDCHTLHGEKPYRIHEIVTLAVIALLLLLVLLSSFYDHFGRPGDKNELLTSFSLITNIKNLVNPETPPGSIDALHGLRFFATSMVVLGHVYMTKGLVGNDINRIRYLEWLSDWEHVWLTSRGILVDAFFVLGGLLAAYVFLKDRGEGKKFSLINFYLHRYLRMAPPMAIVLLFEATLTNRIGSGPDWENCSRRQEKSCQMNWWKHILFIQNWWGIQKCMQHTWYICVDMQLYFLAPVLLIPLHRWPRIGVVLTYSAIVLAFLVSFGLSYGYQEKVDLFRNGGDDLERKLYHATYHRMTPWLIGIILGYYLYQFRHLKDSFRKTTNRKSRSIAEKCLKFVIAIVLWCVCFSLALATWITVHPFIQPDYVYNAFWSATYLATSHIVASLFTVMAVVLILTGYGGPIDMLFSWKACVPLSRLTYSIFLIHLMIVKVRLKDVRTTDFLSDVELLMCWLSVMVFSVSFSIILFLMVEQPFSIIERYILNKGISQTGIRNISNDGKKRSESCNKDVEKSGSGITEKNLNETVHRTWKLFTVFH